MSESMKSKLDNICKKDISTASDSELYTALLNLIQEQSEKCRKVTTGKKLYYISAEFLIGKLLSNNLINLGLYDESVRHWLLPENLLLILRNRNRNQALEMAVLDDWQHVSLTVSQLWISLEMGLDFVIIAGSSIRISKTIFRMKHLTSGLLTSVQPKLRILCFLYPLQEPPILQDFINCR